MRTRTLVIVLSVILFGLFAAEVGLRVAGAMDFPLYQKSEQLGYVLAPSQHGRFINKNDWFFNELSMGVADPFLPKKYARNILLVGDSIVLGGNPVPQREKVGSLLNSQCEGAMIWPVSAGSWAFLNELRYLQLHSSILSDIDRIVFVLNSGDFGRPSVWASESTHPTVRPRSALIGLVRRYLMPDRSSGEGRGTGDWQASLGWLSSNFKKPISMVLYPTKQETSDPVARKRLFNAYETELQSYSPIQLADEAPNWSPSDYRDNIHPTKSGNEKLAHLLRAQIPECSAR